MRHRGPALSIPCAGLVALVLAACEAPREADVPISQVGAQAPPPRLSATARFDAALARALPDARRLDADARDLAARAAALRARAAGLDAPLLTEDDRARLADPDLADPDLADP